MAIFTQYVIDLLEEAGLFVSNIGQTIVIAGVIVGSVVWIVVHLLFRPAEKKLVISPTKSSLTVKPSTSRNTLPPKNKKQYTIVSSFHMKRKSDNFNINWNKYSAPKPCESLWRNREIEKNCMVPCIRCRSLAAERSCRFVMCRSCCQSSKTRTCSYHSAQRGLFNSFCFPRSSLSGRSPTEIDLSYSNLQQCPDRVGFVGAQLVTLNLSNNCLDSLPEEIGCLLGLQDLLLQNNNLHSLPNIIGRLTKLTDLDVAFNKLDTLPDSIGKLKNLYRLRLNNNCLNSLPESTADLIELVELNISYNKVTRLPSKLFQLSKLTELYVRHCCISEVPKKIGMLVRLQLLDFAHNSLSRLPKSLTQCSSLQKLWLSWNRLSRLPDDIGRLHQLMELYIDHNSFQILPHSLMSLQLMVLEVNNNPILDTEEKVYQYSQQRPWWEKSSASENPPIVASKSVPLLTELVECQIILKDLSWKEEILPTNIKERLSNATCCAFCHSPLVSRRKRSFTFVTNRFNLAFLPFEMHSCIGPFHSAKETMMHSINDADFKFIVP